MASLVLGVVGAAVGAPFGQAALGFAVGSALGGYLFAEGLPPQEGPRIQDLKVSSAAYGQPIPIVYGRARIPGKIIWSNGIQERRHEEEVSGGKGGGGSQTVITYTYDVNLAILLCEGPISQVTKIWADGKLIYNATSTSTTETMIASSKRWSYIRVYRGTSNQPVSTVMEAEEGAGNVPAYRHRAVLLINKLQLADFGNRIPNITVEVVSAATEEFIKVSDVDAPSKIGAEFDGSPFTSDNFFNIRGFCSKDISNSGTIQIRNWWNNNPTTGTEIRVRTLNFTAGRFGRYTDKVYSIAPYSIGAHADQNNPFASSEYNTGSKAARWFTNGNPYVLINENASAFVGAHPYPDNILFRDLGSSRTRLLPINIADTGGIDQDNVHLAYRVGNYLYVVLNADTVTSPDYHHVHRWDLDNVGTSDVWYIPTEPNTRQILALDATSQYLYVLEGRQDGVTANLSVMILNVFTHNSNVPVETHVFHTRGDWTANKTNTNGIERIKRIEGIFYFIGASVHTFDPDEDVFSYVGDLSANATYDAANFVGVIPTHVNSDVSVFFNHKSVAAFDSEYGAYIRGFDPSSSSTTTGAILIDLLERAGLNSGEYDVTETTKTVHGYVIARQTDLRQAIEPLMKAFFFDAVESDNKIKFKERTGTSLYTIDGDTYLGAVEESVKENNSLLEITRMQELDLSKRIEVSYIDINKNYETVTQYAGRLITTAVDIQSYEFPIVMTSTQARELANLILYDNWVARQKYRFTLSYKYLKIDPLDVITLDYNGDSYEILVTSVSIGNGLIQVEGVDNDAPIYTTDVEGNDGSAGVDSSVGLGGPTEMVLLDCNTLRSIDSSPGFYVAVGGVSDDWRGCVLYRSNDGGETYAYSNTYIVGTVIGTALTVLGDGVTTIFDGANSVTIDAFTGNGLSSAADDLAVLNGANVCALRSGDGWEIFQFRDAVDNGDGTYTLSRLLRGRRGTESYTAGHAVGDEFVLLDTAGGTQRILSSVNDIGIEKRYIATSLGQTLDEDEAENIAYEGYGLMPLSPVHAKGSRDGSGNLTISWIRRTRLDGEWKDYADVPLNEDTEAYEIDVMNGGNVVRTLTSTSQSVSYTSAQQVADFGSNQSPVNVIIYQMSAQIGRGYPLTAAV